MGVFCVYFCSLLEQDAFRYHGSRVGRLEMEESMQASRHVGNVLSLPFWNCRGDCFIVLYSLAFALGLQYLVLDCFTQGMQHYLEGLGMETDRQALRVE